MMNTLSIAIVILVLLFYISTQTLAFPLVFGYILVLYNLKELPKSQLKTTLAFLSTIGIFINLIQPDLFFLQEIVVIFHIAILSYMMDKKSYHGILSGIVMAMILPIAQIIAYEKQDYFGFITGLIILSLGLYHFYFHFNNYLSDLTPPRLINKPKKYNKIVITSCVIFFIAGSLFSFQELIMDLSISFQDNKYYTPITDHEDIQLQYPIRASLQGGLAYDEPESIAQDFLLDERFYQYEHIELYIGYNPILNLYTYNPTELIYCLDYEILRYSYCKKEDAPQAIEKSDFVLGDYYRAYSLSNNTDVKKETKFYLDDSSIGVQFYFYNDLNNGIKERILIECPAKSSVLKGRTLGMRVETFIQDASSHYLGVDPSAYFSPYLVPLISQATSIKYSLYSKDKSTGVTEIVSSKLSPFEEKYYDFELNRTDFRLPLEKHLDPDKYEYSFEVSFYKGEKELFTSKAVMKP